MQEVNVRVAVRVGESLTYSLGFRRLSLNPLSLKLALSLLKLGACFISPDYLD